MRGVGGSGGWERRDGGGESAAWYRVKCVTSSAKKNELEAVEKGKKKQQRRNMREKEGA